MLTYDREEKDGAVLGDAHDHGLVSEIHERHVNANHAEDVAETDDDKDGVLEERQIEHVLQHVLGDLWHAQTSPDGRLMFRLGVSRDRRDAAYVRPDVRLRAELRDAHYAAAVEDVLPVEWSRIVFLQDSLPPAVVQVRLLVDAVLRQLVRTATLDDVIRVRLVGERRASVGESVR